ncbi:MAG: hypothetical protein QM715_01950 [Nibricoccus sp.]
MSARREDYILRMIEQLRLMVAAAVKFRNGGQLDQALLAIVSAQEKLFARPASDFMALDLDEQLRLLRIDEAPDTAREKCLGYAALLREAGLVYEARDKPELAASAFQSALYILLTTAVETNRPASSETAADIADLLDRIPVDQLHAPVKELLAQLGAQES